MERKGSWVLEALLVGGIVGGSLYFLLRRPFEKAVFYDTPDVWHTPAVVARLDEISQKRPELQITPCVEGGWLTGLYVSPASLVPTKQGATDLPSPYRQSDLEYIATGKSEQAPQETVRDRIDREKAQEGIPPLMNTHEEIPNWLRKDRKIGWHRYSLKDLGIETEFLDSTQALQASIDKLRQRNHDYIIAPVMQGDKILGIDTWLRRYGGGHSSLQNELRAAFGQ